MSYEEIAREALERAEKATEGPWENHNGAIFQPGLPATMTVTHVTYAQEFQANCEFIAHSREDVPDLARAVLEQKETIERQNETYQRLRKLYDDELDRNVEHIKEIERLERELFGEKASQATRGNG